MKRGLGSSGQGSPKSEGYQNQENKGNHPIISSLNEPVSPPRRRSTANKNHKAPLSPHPPEGAETRTQSPPNLASIEAGQVEVTDHLGIFSSQLSQYVRPAGFLQSPRLQIADWVDLYRRNLHPYGKHFLIHQHDHPVAGPHYDLRLQFSETSSVSWSVMYGLPGDPNSRRLNRNATETRVHCLWNHLIETASLKTGSMIIWDTGEYEILPYQIEHKQPDTDDSRSEVSDTPLDEKTQSEKLWEAFQNRKIRLRLHGCRLPPNYTIILRLDKASSFTNTPHVPQKRRKRTQSSTLAIKNRQTTSSSSDSSSPVPSDGNYQDPTSDNQPSDLSPGISKVDENADSSDEMDYQIRANNAYPGSTNSIGSIHQRRWFITMDRLNSGFIEETSTTPGRKRWVPKRDPETGHIVTGFEPFYVRGPDVERSVVTGRLGREVLEDEDVSGFLPRRGWRPVLQ
ncbi:hypothetical protein ASPWEDRAFT_102577 [Aspergillus wentii DTO 134E9]|uniref:DNA ligase D 3'-phosphoesterase domain-containing protein n=1 Tax=Aspergillus wentii DTO 134E9 TaxID=1073089 RepID=A0A1L9S1H6_ASPWE|nr:uncharacterized protein ASPWEDRAFT_102577 [Aspergillus wentii DTO 134E9]OJJ41014.1 hypothetical protein ASPWEDRAFT_102577 [Aspergillus wentii DTO 134E9]